MSVSQIFTTSAICIRHVAECSFVVVVVFLTYHEACFTMIELGKTKVLIDYTV